MDKKEHRALCESIKERTGHTIRSYEDLVMFLVGYLGSEVTLDGIELEGLLRAFRDARNNPKKTITKTNRLRELREMIGLTQEALAKASGVHIRTIQKYEIGEALITNMPLKNAIPITKVLGVAAEELCKEDRE